MIDNSGSAMRRCARCLDIACSRRGYHAKGTVCDYIDPDIIIFVMLSVKFTVRVIGLLSFKFKDFFYFGLFITTRF